MQHMTFRLATIRKHLWNQSLMLEITVFLLLQKHWEKTIFLGSFNSARKLLRIFWGRSLLGWRPLCSRCKNKNLRHPLDLSAESYGGAIAGLPKPLNLSIHLLALMFTIEELIFGEDGNVVSKTFQKPWWRNVSYPARTLIAIMPPPMQCRSKLLILMIPSDPKCSLIDPTTCVAKSRQSWPLDPINPHKSNQSGLHTNPIKASWSFQFHISFHLAVEGAQNPRAIWCQIPPSNRTVSINATNVLQIFLITRSIVWN